MKIEVEVTEKFKRAAQGAASRGLCYLPLLPIERGEFGHHINSLYVIGIPSKVHNKCKGSTLKVHRKKVIMWLEENNQYKYQLVMKVLKEKLKWGE